MFFIYRNFDSLTWPSRALDRADISKFKSPIKINHVKVSVSVKEPRFLFIYRYFDTLTWAILGGDLGRADFSLSKSPHKIGHVKVFLMYLYVHCFLIFPSVELLEKLITIISAFFSGKNAFVGV